MAYCNGVEKWKEVHCSDEAPYALAGAEQDPYLRVKLDLKRAEELEKLIEDEKNQSVEEELER